MTLIEKGHRQISRHLDLTRVRVLGTVAARGPVRPGAIAAELGLTASATSRHLAALEDAGQVAVEPDPADGRTFLVRQTEGGRADIDSTLRAGAAVFTAVIADWPDEDVESALRLISRLNQAWADRGDTARRGTGTEPGPRWRRERRSGDAHEREA
jgi:DNA-binding MarR family transcriptional regulator